MRLSKESRSSFIFIPGISIFAGLIVLGFVASGFAGGPARTMNGVPLRWDPTDPVSFVLDNGPLRTGGMGEGISRDQAAEFIRTVLLRWQDVLTSSLRVQDRGFLPEDVVLANHRNYLFQVRDEGNPIIFDADGQIIDEVLGANASEDVLGFAGSFELTGDNRYDYGVVVLNGLEASLSPTGEFGKTLLHEFGHLIGLDHTQVGLEFFLEADEETVIRTVPLMFPFSSPGPPELLEDDRVWVTFLYPVDDAVLETGAIRGRVSRRIGTPFRGAHVLAFPVERDEDDNPLLQMENRVGVVSGFLNNPDDSLRTAVPGAGRIRGRDRTDSSSFLPAAAEWDRSTIGSKTSPSIFSTQTSRVIPSWTIPRKC